MARGLAAQRLATLVLAGLFAGCASSLAYDSDGLERQIPALLVPDDPEVVTDVQCPDVLPLTTISTRCLAVIGGSQVGVDVMLTEDGDAEISSDAYLVETASIAAAARARLGEDLDVVTVTCPGSAVVVSVPDSQIACDAIDSDGNSHSMTVTIISATGDFAISFG